MHKQQSLHYIIDLKVRGFEVKKNQTFNTENIAGVTINITAIKTDSTFSDVLVKTFKLKYLVPV